MNTLKLFTLTLLCMTFTSVAEAKWWIFGQANEEVTINYLYLNDIPYDESGQKLTVYRDMLTGGEIILRGKARIDKGKIGGASVSLDNRATWNEAQFSSDGSFEYRFRPEIGKTYIMYVEVIDTAGKANDIESTRKEVIVGEGSFQKLMRETLDTMMAAYRDEDPAAFMSHVSEDFVADPSVLDRAIRRDFAIFDNIDLRYTLNNVASGSDGLFVAITFNRKLTSTRDGKTYTDKGVTEFVFRLTDKGPKVFSMKFPLIFGLSDSDEIATGTVNTGNNEPTIVVTNDGSITTIPFSDAVNGTTSEESVESGVNIAVTFGQEAGGMHGPAGFDFVAGEVGYMGTGDPVAFGITGGDETSGAWTFLQTGYVVSDLGSVTLNSVNQAPESGYGTEVAGGYLLPGHTYAFSLPNGTYALMEVKSVSASYTPSYQVTMRIDYKYQSNGSRNF